MVAMLTRTACIVSLWRKTSTGRLPTNRGFALPNFSFASAVSVYESAETVNPSCVSFGREAAVSFDGESGFRGGELSCPTAPAHTNSATARSEMVRVVLRHDRVSVPVCRMPGNRSKLCAVRCRHYSADLELENPHAM